MNIFLSSSSSPIGGGGANIYQIRFTLGILLFLDILLETLTIASGDISNHITKCCLTGTKYAKKSGNCKDYDYEVDTIPSLWRGLCVSTFGVCCSRELQQQNCVAGRLAAKTGSRCDEKFNTTFYADCCKSCQIGLAVAASDNQCDDSLFAYFSKDESYNLCCNEHATKSAGSLPLASFGSNAKKTADRGGDDAEENVDVGNVSGGGGGGAGGSGGSGGDGTVILVNDDDICGKVEKLCEHICENTNDSYVCKCRNGYKLDDNKVTCSPIIGNGIAKMATNPTGDGDVSDDNEEDNDDGLDGEGSFEEGDDTDNSSIVRSCPIGYKRNDKKNQCLDIDECLIGNGHLTKCKPDQYCHNTIGGYRCLNIESTNCTAGYRFNTKSEMCEDINECLQQSDDCIKDEQQCVNTKGGYTCLFKQQQQLVLDKTKCKTGYIYSAVADKCEDYNECDDLPCDEGYVCINYPGSYDCRKRLAAGGGGGKAIDEEGTSGTVAAVPPYTTSGRLSSKLTSTTTTTGNDKCSSGFRIKHGRCIDIDECLVDKNTCDSNQICTNDIGGYHCDCRIGFNMDSTLNACVDINECSINNHNCLPTQRCDNTIGSYICIRLQSCGTGYTLNAETGNCDDDDECAANTHTCTPEYECRNTKGSFRCDRRRRSSTTTTTTTTTATPTTKTTKAQPVQTTAISTTTTTTTTPQSYFNNSQSYNAGKYHPPSSSSSSPLSSPPPSHGSQHHVSRYGSMDNSPTYVSSQTFSHQHRSNDYSPRYGQGGEISCGTGFYRNHLGACVDVNECYLSSPCGSHQRCINTNGSYRCQNLLQCGAGFKSTPDGTSCIDIDECETGEHNCAENQICRNRNGGYVCSCPPGHALAKHGGVNRCIDINECEHDKPQVCPSNAQCVNTIGSYYCECKSGFQKQRDNEKLCNDVDECQEIPGLCQQKCVNFWGGYRCTCNAGYELSADNRTCNDIDECEVHKSYKLCMGFCVNVPGSYECTCPRGYELAMDKNTCRDIDECATGEFCTGRNDICTNIRGSYKCTTIRCPYGYTNDPDQKNRCRQISNLCDGDDCYNKPSAYTYNFITLVSKLQIPPDGRVIFSLRGPTWYESIDFDLKILKIQAAANIEKASENHFGTFKRQHQVELSLIRSLDGPQDIELELSMTVFMNGQPRGKSVAKVFIIVSQYSF